MSQKQKMGHQHIYQLELTERQAKLLSWTCDTFTRIIEGQDRTYQEMMEAAWEKRCKEATGKSMDKEWNGGWYQMREDAERMAKEMKKRFWGLESNAFFGVNYDEASDVIWDIYQVIRHQLWKDDPDRQPYTVNAYDATQFGDEPLAIIRRMDNNKETN